MSTVKYGISKFIWLVNFIILIQIEYLHYVIYSFTNFPQGILFLKSYILLFLKQVPNNYRWQTFLNIRILHSIIVMVFCTSSLIITL